MSVDMAEVMWNSMVACHKDRVAGMVEWQVTWEPWWDGVPVDPHE
jgi:hypothetical protein